MHFNSFQNHFYNERVPPRLLRGGFNTAPPVSHSGFIRIVGGGHISIVYSGHFVSFPSSALIWKHSSVMDGCLLTVFYQSISSQISPNEGGATLDYWDVPREISTVMHVIINLNDVQTNLSPTPPFPIFRSSGRRSSAPDWLNFCCSFLAPSKLRGLWEKENMKRWKSVRKEREREGELEGDRGDSHPCLQAVTFTLMLWSGLSLADIGQSQSVFLSRHPNVLE